MSLYPNNSQPAGTPAVSHRKWRRCAVAILLLSLAGAFAGWVRPDGELSAPARTAAPDTRRALLLTVDDLPIAAGSLHPDFEDRLAITKRLLAVMKKHGIRAVGLVTGKNVRTDRDWELLDLWLAAGHELGNHSFGHLNYTETEADAYIADAEKNRALLAGFLDRRGRKLRFFRFPMLREGDTPEKLRAMREYLAGSGQRNLPVTIDNQDWSFEKPWVEAGRKKDARTRADLAQDYRAMLDIETKAYEERGDTLFGRPMPQILLLHANEVGADNWDALFTRLERTGHRFAPADDVLADPAFTETHAVVAPFGYSLWLRYDLERREREARARIEELIGAQVADWNRGDLEAFCRPYADDAAFVTPKGITRGREEVLRRYRASYADPAAMGTLAIAVDEIRLISGTEVSVFGDAVPGRVHGATLLGRWTLTFAGKPPATGFTLLVLRRTAQGWRIVQDASM